MGKRGLPDKVKTLLQVFDLRYLNGWNSVRSGLGFTRHLLRPSRHADNLEQIFNFLALSPTLASSGQPTEVQFKRIARAGFTIVINLAPHWAENSLDDEAGILHQLGIHYMHIPVNFKQPTEWHYLRFCQAMKEAGDQQVWVHCAANLRASSFIYRYRVEKLGIDREIALQDLHRIWTPFGVWKDFIEGKAA